MYNKEKKLLFFYYLNPKIEHSENWGYKKMRLNLLLVDFLVWIFYISKGFIGAKIKAELDIKKNRKHIEDKYFELENKKIIPDNELIKNFPDKIFVPVNVAKGNLNNIFNSILEKLSKKAKAKIFQKT